MKVIHSGSVNVQAGGPALSTYLTIKGLKEAGVKVDIICQPIPKSGKIIDDSIKPIFSRPSTFGRFHYVPGLNETLNHVGVADVYHIQGLWMASGWQVAKFAQRHNIPYVVTLRGMLYPQALAKNPMIKKLSLLLYQRSVLSGAAAVQCTCAEEADYYRQMGFHNPVAIIPNPIEYRNIDVRNKCNDSGIKIGYLGRIHPRKRIERLIYSFHNLREYLNDAELIIIGGGDEQYEQFLRDEALRLNLKNIKFTGFLTGEAKHNAISSLDCLVVPSDFENFGNIVTEALVRGVPVIASKGTPWKSLEDNKCGFWIDNDQKAIDKAIKRFIDLPLKERQEMSIAGRNMVERDYSVTTLGLRMKELYNWILSSDHDSVPSFVRI